MQKILELDYAIDDEDDQGRTALIYACYRDNLDSVKFLIQNGADINYQTNLEKPLSNIYGLSEFFGATALHTAIKRNHLPIIEYLLQYQPNLYVSTKSSIDVFNINKHMNIEPRTLISDAVSNIDIMMLLFSKINYKYHNLTTLHYEAYHGNLHNITNKDCRADLDVIYENFGTALHLAIRQGHILVIKHFVTKYNVIIDGDALKIAIIHNQYFIFKYLMRKINIAEYSHLTLLAIEYKALNIIKLFYEKGCFEMMDKNLAIVRAWEVMDYEIMKFLLEHGINPNAQLLLFNYYVENPNIHIMKMLIDFGLDLTVKNANDETIIDNLINNMDLFCKFRFEMLMLLLCVKNMRYNLDKLKIVLQKYKAKEIYYRAESRCPADDMIIENHMNRNTFVDEIERIVENQIECCICMEYNSNFTHDGCSHVVICTECACRVDKCPQCLALF